ncbi:MAG: SDR family NAD(P)-dependent oxidoreductase, partial [Candidatus Puniceispirillaceae bacterium]
MENAHLKGRRAVVTGGARGMGYAVAKRYLEQGASVSLWDLDEAGLSQAANSLSSLGTV